MANDGRVKIGTELDDSGLKDGLSGVKNIAKDALVAAGAVATGAAVSFAAMSKSALDSVASLEQNVGGVETLFKDSAQTVVDNANNAFKTAGMSANEYMQSVTSFSASLLQSVAGDTAEAAKIADMAMVDMSDNANKMGTDMEAIQNAYQGFAKQNYTMLDNLKLGYGGTKTEMERLLADAQKISGVKYDIRNLNDVYSAIHVIQGELGITGTTAKEASNTIEGSMTSAKAAFDNFLNGSGSAEEFADSLSTAARNVVDALGEIIPRLAETLPGIASAVAEQIPVLISSLLPALVDGAIALVGAFAEQLPEILASLASVAPVLIEAAAGLMEQVAVAVQEFDFVSAAQTAIDGIADFLTGDAAGSLADAGLSVLDAVGSSIIESVPELVSGLSGALSDGLPEMAEKGAELLGSVAEGLLKNAPKAIQAAGNILNQLLGALLTGLPKMLDAGIKLLGQVAQGILNNLPAILSAIGQVIGKLLATIVSNLPQLLAKGVELIAKLAAGIVQAVPKVVAAVPKVISGIVKGFTSHDWGSVGKNLIDGVANGIKNGASRVAKAAKNAAKRAFDAAKDFLGINSPSRLMRDMIGKNMIAGFESGIVSETPNLEKTSAGSAQKAVESMQGVALGRSGTVASAVESNMNPNPGGGNGGNTVVVLEKGSITGDVTMDGEKVGTIVAPTVDIEIEKARKESER